MFWILNLYQEDGGASFWWVHGKSWMLVKSAFPCCLTDFETENLLKKASLLWTKSENKYLRVFCTATSWEKPSSAVINIKNLDWMLLQCTGLWKAFFCFWLCNTSAAAYLIVGCARRYVSSSVEWFMPLPALWCWDSLPPLLGVMLQSKWPAMRLG